ncbi:MAG: HAD family acid phosphatase [Mycobacterium sp.]
MFRIGVLTSTLLLCLAPTAAAEPPNLSDVKDQVVTYHDSGAYLADLTTATRPALAWLSEQAPRVPRPAAVFDIDETSLSNWEGLSANDFGRIGAGSCDDLPHGPCGLVAWTQLARSTVIEPTLAVYQEARKDGVTVFFITGRDESMRDATVRNLADAGYTDYAELVLQPLGSHPPSAVDYKAPQRARIESEGYTIIANLGDQPSDLAGGHAQRTYLLPNPFYRIP